MESEISSRAELIDALRLAAELEHGLMAQYLFAAYSLKRYDYEGLAPEQLERVRRWASLITLVARQEMEHLGLALNLLSSVGGTPSFSRPNMPQPAGYYGAACIKLTLTRCDLETVKRFQRFEAPDELAHAVDTKCTEAPEPIDQEKADEWCERKGVGRAKVAAKLVERSKAPAEGRLPKGRLLKGAPHVDLYGIPYKSVQELYEKIARGFEHLTAKMGERRLFVGKTTNQIFGGPSSPQHGTMNDLNQYGLDIISVTDLASARQAVTMIVEQGEGIRVPPSYKPFTHFCIFSRIRAEMEEHGLGERAARAVVANPMTVRRATLDGRPHAPLVGARVALLDAQIIEHNGILTRNDLFIIDPLRVRVTADGETVLLDRDDWLNPANPQMPQWEATSPMLLRRQPKRFVTNSPEVAAATGLPDPSNRSLIANRKERRKSLEALLREIARKKEKTKEERVAEAALETRIEQLKIVEKWWDLSEGTWDERPIDRRAYTLALQLEGWDIGVNGPAYANTLGGDETRPWPLRFWMGGWDGDALCAYVRGSWEIPLL